ncbi:MAG: hypothetical protein A2Y69_06795 [Candidatus Aminicenantes bacterium RBG_13_59_9]|nr:MAG: hypothetical protein A2Y69_06795 [Candidatus Aminicenantes bacterium RBG_13_59_9]
MRKALFIISIMSILILMGSALEGMDTRELQTKIEKIKSCLERPGGPGPDGDMMFNWLLEAILQAAPETGFPPEFTENMKKAKEHTDTKSMFNPDGYVYLNKAYRLINEGHDFEMPDSISDIQDIVNYAIMKLASARENLKPYKVDLAACVKELVFVAVMIMAPQHE